jgi:hypothetical protein
MAAKEHTGGADAKNHHNTERQRGLWWFFVVRGTRVLACAATPKGVSGEHPREGSTARSLRGGRGDVSKGAGAVKYSKIEYSGARQESYGNFIYRSLVIWKPFLVLSAGVENTKAQVG